VADRSEKRNKETQSGEKTNSYPASSVTWHLEGRTISTPADCGISVDGMRRGNEGGPKNRLDASRSCSPIQIKGERILWSRVPEFRSLVDSPTNEAGGS